MTSIGIVVIGRNEGERLRRCLSAVRRTGMPCVYVDSGSTDGSLEIAEAIIGNVVRLDAGTPFTAARGRNEGFRCLLAQHPEMVFVQFVDGDCELDPGWIARASRELLAQPHVAIVCGRLREAQPHASVYNLLCDIEWNRPAGVVAACGGIFMARVEAFRHVSGFNASIAAGEEPELCLRLRRQGMSILRIDAPMAVHDADMHRFGQWWVRAMRSGRTAAECLCRSWPRIEWRDARRVMSIMLWTLGIPLAALAAAWPTGGLSFLLFAAYPLQWLRLWWRHYRKKELSARDSAVGATFTFVGKVAELIGLLQSFRSLTIRRLPRRPLARSRLQAEPRRSHAQF